MVVGELPDGLGLLKQFYATLHQHLFEQIRELEVPVGHSLVGQRARPQPLL